MFDLDKIKNKYGEKMAHLCRTLFPTLLEQDGLLYSILYSKFAPSKFLYSDIIRNNLIDKFKEYIDSFTVNEEELIVRRGTPKELMNEVGYILFECKCEQDIKMFDKYYVDSEKLCTFKDIKNRLDNYYIFFAVKKNVDDIKREDFKCPERQDEYGTSVICLQFKKGVYNKLSIKNRYNHTVKNPDATFCNNLENVVQGLTRSFELTYNLDIRKNEKKDFEIPNYVKAEDGKFYKYNYEIHNIYYCPNNIIIDNFKVKKDYQEKERYIIFDYFILDMKEKIIKLYDQNIKDSFIDEFDNIQKVQIRKTKDKKFVCIEINNINVIIVLDKENKIISYQNGKLTKVNNSFLKYNYYLKTLYLPNVKEVDDNFLYNNTSIKSIFLPLVEIIGNSFLYKNNSIDYIIMPNINKIGNNFLYHNNILKRLYFPKINEIGNHFLHKNSNLTSLNFPYLIKIGDWFIEENIIISSVYMPHLEVVGRGFLLSNDSLKELSLPNLKIIGDAFMKYNKKLELLVIPYKRTLNIK